MERAFIVRAEDEGNREGGTRMGNWGGEDDTFMTSAAAFPTSSRVVVVQSAGEFLIT